jgi:hypothetical protein
MPCRALEAFRPKVEVTVEVDGITEVLMPCRALEAFRPCQTLWEFHPLQILFARLCILILHPFPDSVNSSME